MTPLQTLVAALIALAVAVSVLRSMRRGAGRRGIGRPLQLGLQLLAAVLLWWLLFPPGDARPARSLTVLTAGAENMDPALWAGDPSVVALPEAGSLAAADRALQRVPDLASALRAAPEVKRLRLIGDGLELRDQSIDPGIEIEFVAAPQRPGLVEIDHPEVVAAGRPWSVHGRIAALPDAAVVLRDMAGIEVARAGSTSDGRFRLAVPGAPVGRLSFELALLDAAGQPVEVLALPVAVASPDPLRVALRSGAPNPELKYLRRWAIDAGLALDSRIFLTRGARLGDGPERWDAANLADYDLLLFDERAWSALSAPEQQAIEDAVRAGLGLMIRLTAQPSAELRAQLAQLGFTVDAAEIGRGVRLAAAGDPRSADAMLAEATAKPIDNSIDNSVDNSSANPAVAAASLELTRRPLQVSGTDTVALVRDVRAEPLGLWRSLGRGRVSLLWLTDSHRLVLTGDDARYGALWSEMFAVLARARADRLPQWQPRHRWPDQRAVVCGLTAPADVLGPDGATVRLVPDPDLVGGTCAGYWPRQGGWHNLRHAGAELPFHIHRAEAGPELRAMLVRAATLRLIAGRPGLGDADPTAWADPAPSRWTWFVLWLLASGLLWWLERRLRRSSPRDSSVALETVTE